MHRLLRALRQRVLLSVHASHATAASRTAHLHVAPRLTPPTYSSSSSSAIVRAYRIFVLVDAGDEWVQDLPDDGICFRKPGLDETRASAEELRQAHRATSEV